MMCKSIEIYFVFEKNNHKTGFQYNVFKQPILVVLGDPSHSLDNLFLNGPYRVDTIEHIFFMTGPYLSKMIASWGYREQIIVISIFVILPGPCIFVKYETKARVALSGHKAGKKSITRIDKQKRFYQHCKFRTPMTIAIIVLGWNHIWLLKYVVCSFDNQISLR